jgi:hypothetical protein
MFFFSQWLCEMMLQRLYNYIDTSVSDGIGFKADPDPAVHLNEDPYPDADPGIQISADPCGSGCWSAFSEQKVGF